MSKAAKQRLIKIVESFPRLTITVLGDLVADEFVFGEISRVSREAPGDIRNLGSAGRKSHVGMGNETRTT